jgi:hypothetical protein
MGGPTRSAAALLKHLGNGVARASLVSIGLAGIGGGARFGAVNLADLDLQCKRITSVSVTAQGADSGKDG